MAAIDFVSGEFGLSHKMLRKCRGIGRMRNGGKSDEMCCGLL